MEVSVIIPCYNCEAYVNKAIDSALKQNISNFEIILVDNNSKDGTLNTINGYQEKYPELITVLKEDQPGAPAARNAGLRAAKGRWIQFLDADDIILPSKIANQLRLVDNKYDLCVGSSKFFSSNGDYLFKTTPNTSNVWLSLIMSNLGNTVANLWKRDILMAIQGWNSGMSSSQEYDLLFRYLTQTDKIIYDLEFNTAIFRLENSISQSSDLSRSTEIAFNAINLRLKIKNYLIANGLFTESCNSAINTYIFASILRLDKSIRYPENISSGIKSIPLIDRITAFKGYISWLTLKQKRSRANVGFRFIRNFLFELPRVFTGKYDTVK